MCEEIRVGISEYKITSFPNKLVTIALGSCVGVAIYNGTNRTCGLAHIMLPNRKMHIATNNAKEAKFADKAIPNMVAELIEDREDRLVAKIVGGAAMFDFYNNIEDTIGYKNIKSIYNELDKLGIEIIGKDIGGNKGRSMRVDLENFTVEVKTTLEEVKII